MFLALAACGPATQTGSSAVTGATSQNTLDRFAANARACWFSGDPRFEGLALIDERDSRAKRLLVVRRTSPQDRPRMVIEVRASKLAVYGPLATPAIIRQAKAFARGRIRNGRKLCT